MSTIIEADATDTLRLLPSQMPQADAGGREAWLQELERRRERGATGKPGTPLQEILDDIRGERG